MPVTEAIVGSSSDRRVFMRSRAMGSERVQMIDDFKPLPVLRIVDRADIGQMVKRGLGRIVQKPSPDRECAQPPLDGHAPSVPYPPRRTAPPEETVVFNVQRDDDVVEPSDFHAAHYFTNTFSR